ncbi:hypothetical protein [Grimontia sp. SpTr1]|uniref:hypothetical protein n=1 Tax=Grimontia sp. SpTr1 TaxID=2995319 RepID=UPI00248CDC83|nr:hypothetical protein [Grimontia sp. SpTr1]
MGNSEKLPMSKLVKELTVAEIEDLRELVISVSEALEMVPKSFDNSFQSKINRIIDVSSDLEASIKKLLKEVEKVQISESTINKPKMNSNGFTMKTAISGLLFGFLGSLIGGGVFYILVMFG